MYMVCRRKGYWCLPFAASAGGDGVGSELSEVVMKVQRVGRVERRRGPK